MGIFHVRKSPPWKNKLMHQLHYVKTNIPATTIMPNGSWALVFPYIFPNIQIKIPSMPILAIETIDRTREVDSI